MAGYVLACLILFPILLFGQDTPQPMQQSCADGQWQNITSSQESNFTRYFICGAEMNYYKKVMPYTCTLSKQRGQPFITICDGGQTLSQRSNGIKFKYCNFQNWDDQTSAQYFGSFEWQGLKMCPKDYYVNGFQTKISDNDGLNGLMLNCRPRFLTYGTASRVDVVVKDGNGSWSNSSISATNVAAYYEVKVGNDYLTGLKLTFRPFPTIIKIGVEYDNIAPPDLSMDTISSTSFENRGANLLTSIFNSDSAKKTKIYGLTFYNIFKNKYHGEKIRKFVNDNYTQLQILIPTILSKAEAPEIEVDRKLGYKLQKFSWDQFQFGKTLFRGLPLTVPPPTFSTPVCTRTDVKERVYTVYVQIRYTTTITYTSFNQTFNQKITGIYKGTAFSRTEIIATQVPICPP